MFLLHNQFAVWIPLHITLNIHSLLDPAKSLSFFLPSPVSLHLSFQPLASLFVSPSNLEMSNLCRSNIFTELKAVQNSHLSVLFFLLTSLGTSHLLFLSKMCVVFPLVTVDSAPTAFSGNTGDLGSNYIRVCLCVPVCGDVEVNLD